MLDGEIVSPENRDRRQLFSTIFSDHYLFDDLAYGALPTEAGLHLARLSIAHRSVSSRATTWMTFPFPLNTPPYADHAGAPSTTRRNCLIVFSQITTLATPSRSRWS